MNLLERKTDFGAKVNKYLQALNDPFQETEKHYTNYLVEVYKKEFKAVSHSTERNYVIVEFNKQINNN